MTAPQEGQGGSLLTRKMGPLPTWAWMAMLVVVLVLYSQWQKNKQQSASATSAMNANVQQANTPDQIWQNYNYNTAVFQPPAGGNPFPPTGTTPQPSPAPVPPIWSGPAVSPAPAPVPAPVPARVPSGQWVTVSRWTASNTPWNSTLWGISQHVLGNGSKWQSIWNDPQNASLKARRKQPELIQPGDKIWVPQ